MTVGAKPPVLGAGVKAPWTLFLSWCTAPGIEAGHSGASCRASLNPPGRSRHLGLPPLLSLLRGPFWLTAVPARRNAGAKPP